MSNLSTQAKLIVSVIDKDAVDETALIEILETDLDFRDNTSHFRPDTLKKGFKNEAERISKEIFTKFKKLEEEERILKMVKELFKVPNFIGQSNQYGDSDFKITETDFSYVVSIAVII
jgi:Sec7-like guanine-nucleotide exchange factor